MSLESEIRRIVRDELKRVANGNHSAQMSAAGIAALVGDDQCDEITKRESMDPINTERSGEITMSSEEAMERGRRFTMSIQQGNWPKTRSAARGSKHKATR